MIFWVSLVILLSSVQALKNESIHWSINQLLLYNWVFIKNCVIFNLGEAMNTKKTSDYDLRAHYILPRCIPCYILWIHILLK